MQDASGKAKKTGLLRIFVENVKSGKNKGLPQRNMKERNRVPFKAYYSQNSQKEKRFEKEGG